jgi:hypothetical protein
MFRVEVTLSDIDRLVQTVEAMRNWLDSQRFVPLTFGYSLTAARVLFRIDFASETHADAFAEAFDGSIVH